MVGNHSSYHSLEFYLFTLANHPLVSIVTLLLPFLYPTPTIAVVIKSWHIPDAI